MKGGPITGDSAQVTRERERERERERHRHRQTERERQRERERDIEKYAQNKSDRKVCNRNTINNKACHD